MNDPRSIVAEWLNRSGSGSIERLEDAQALYHQGDERNDIFIIESGYLKFERVDAAGANAITAIECGSAIRARLVHARCRGTNGARQGRCLRTTIQPNRLSNAQRT